jgi:tetratricopeptide (TPR) repeat protein
LLQTAIGLGDRDPIAYYYLALSIINDTPDDTREARNAIQQALQLAPQDPYIQALAGRIEYLQHNYQASLDYLHAALRLWPDMVEAHQDLAATYRAMGNREMSIAELKEVLRIKQQIRSAAQAPPFPIENLLFTVRPPTHPSM